MDWCACYACAPVLTHVQYVVGFEAQRANVANGLKKMGRRREATSSLATSTREDGDYGLLRRQHVVEKIAGLLLLACAAVSVITTVGIIVILLTEALRFFASVVSTCSAANGPPYSRTTSRSASCRSFRQQ